MQTWKYNKVMFVHLNWFFLKIKHKYFIENPEGQNFISEQYEYFIFFYFWNEQKTNMLKNLLWKLMQIYW